MDKNYLYYHILNKFNVSRETFPLLEEYFQSILKENKKINLISDKNDKNLRERHIIDCAQIIDLIDKKQKICTDLGSGAGLPGIVIAILLKQMNLNITVNLYEKSFHKSNFLRCISEKLKLKTQIFQKDILEEKNLVTGSIIARAFKPLPIILDILNKSFKNYSNLIVFMGKNGKQTLEDASNEWEFEYKKKVSVTSKDSFLLNIKKIKKK